MALVLHGDHRGFLTKQACPRAEVTEGGEVRSLRCRARRYVPVGVLLVLAGSVLACIGITVDGGPVPTPPFPIEDLLLDESAFPGGWQAHVPFEPRARFGLPVGVTYYSPGSGGGVALHEVYVSRDPEEATERYQEAVRFWFTDDERYTAWSAPAELRHRSVLADQFRVGCHIQQESGIQFCQAVAQYGRYVAWFHTYMSPSMTFADLERILTAIDERMALYLAKDME